MQIHTERGNPVDPTWLLGVDCFRLEYQLVDPHPASSVDLPLLGIAYSPYQSITVKSNSLRSFWNFSAFRLPYIHIENNKFLPVTNSKLRNSDSKGLGYSDEEKCLDK